jgi:hypothetical protein
MDRFYVFMNDDGYMWAAEVGSPSDPIEDEAIDCWIIDAYSEQDAINRRVRNLYRTVAKR